MKAIRRLLCRLGLHIYGPWTLTRWNPALDLFTVHRHCLGPGCRRCKAQLIRGVFVPKDATREDLARIAKARAKA